MTCPRWRHGPLERDAGHPAHSAAGSSSTCAKHTFMCDTCQAKTDAAVESRVSKSARPFDKLRAGSGARPVLLCQHLRATRVILAPEMRATRRSGADTVI